MSVLDIHTTIVMYGDGDVATSNPQRRYTDWQRHTTGVAVTQPSVREYLAQPGELLSIFSGTRATSIDGTSSFAITLNPVKAAVYRITNTGGTAPAFRTKRAYNPSTVLHTLAVNNNATMTITVASGSFTGAGVVVGDTVFIPGTTTGDTASPFNANNVGFWNVLSVAAQVLTVRRPVGQAFNGVAEAITPTLGSQIVIFSAAGVQQLDSLEISAGFSVVTQKSFVVSDVTDNWVEFTSTENLPLEAGILPTATGMTFYVDAKRFIRVEADQAAVVRLNGDTGSTNRVEPRVVGDLENVGHFEKWGPVWQLQVLNRSTVSPMRVTVISAE